MTDPYANSGGEDDIARLLEEIPLLFKARAFAESLGDPAFFSRLGERLDSREQALRTAHRLRKQVAKPLQIDDVVLQPRISIGIAMTSDPLTAAADLLHQADLAMYRAKREAADSVAIYDPRLEG